MDRVVVALGFVMIAMTGYVAFVSVPGGAALRNTVWPEAVDFLAITTLVGGTVGGYTPTPAPIGWWTPVSGGGERRCDRSRVGARVLVTGLMRVLLFLAVLGVVRPA